MSLFGFNIPPLELDCSIFNASGVPVLIITRLTLLEIARISYDRHEQSKAGPLISAGQHCGSGKENEIKDLNYEAT